MSRIANAAGKRGHRVDLGYHVHRRMYLIDNARAQPPGPRRQAGGRRFLYPGLWAYGTTLAILATALD